MSSNNLSLEKIMKMKRLPLDINDKMLEIIKTDFVEHNNIKQFCESVQNNNNNIYVKLDTNIMAIMKIRPDSLLNVKNVYVADKRFAALKGNKFDVETIVDLKNLKCYNEFIDIRSNNTALTKSCKVYSKQLFENEYNFTYYTDLDHAIVMRERIFPLNSYFITIDCVKYSIVFNERGFIERILAIAFDRKIIMNNQYYKNGLISESSVITNNVHPIEQSCFKIKHTVIYGITGSIRSSVVTYIDRAMEEHKLTIACNSKPLYLPKINMPY